eukprot:2440379-Ditylum_brightwellii.AAC.1
MHCPKKSRKLEHLRNAPVPNGDGGWVNSEHQQDAPVSKFNAGWVDLEQSTKCTGPQWRWRTGQLGASTR